MPRYRLTPRARRGLIHIVLQVEDRFGAAVANRVVDALERAFVQLAEHPGIGHRRADLTSDERVRFWSVGPTLLAYRERDGDVEVLFVERAELDWDRLLDERL